MSEPIPDNYLFGFFGVNKPPYQAYLNLNHTEFLDSELSTCEESEASWGLTFFNPPVLVIAEMPVLNLVQIQYQRFFNATNFEDGYIQNVEPNLLILESADVPVPSCFKAKNLRTFEERTYFSEETFFAEVENGIFKN